MIARNNQSATHPGGVQGPGVANGANPPGTVNNAGAANNAGQANVPNDTANLSPLSTANRPFTRAGYPPIYGATPQQAQEIWNYMSAVPLEDRQSVSGIHVGNDHLTGTLETTGQNGNGQTQAYGEISLNSGDLQNPDLAQSRVLGETGHAVEIHNGVLNGPTQGIWQNAPDVNQPAPPQNPLETFNLPSETFANAYAAYYSGNGKTLYNTSPQEYNAIASGAFRNPGYVPNAADQAYAGATQIGKAIAQNPQLFGQEISSIGNQIANNLGNPAIGKIASLAGQILNESPSAVVELLNFYVNKSGFGKLTQPGAGGPGYGRLLA